MAAPTAPLLAGSLAGATTVTGPGIDANLSISPQAAGGGGSVTATLAKTVPYVEGGVAPTLGVLTVRPFNEANFLAGAADQVTFRVLIDGDVASYWRLQVE